MKIVRTLHILSMVGLCGVGCGSEAMDEEQSVSDPVQAAPPGEIARIEFPDGGVVTFNTLGDVIAIGELGHIGNARHYVAAGQTPEQAFRELAPDREVPEALIAAGDITFPASDASAEGETAAEGVDAPSDETIPKDHGGRSPFSAIQPTCLFRVGPLPPLVPKNSHQAYWIYNDRTANGSSPTNKVGSGWSMVASDLGEVRHELVRTGYSLSQGVVAQGHWHDWTWSSPRVQECSGTCIWWSCATVCVDRGPSTRVDVKGVTSNENYHHCGYTDL